MYEAITRRIRVHVVPQFIEDESDAGEQQFVWAYTITIENDGSESVQLKSRYWRITDESGHVEEVRGPGVVGQTPHIAPGQSFRYTSGCRLTTPSGIMVGRYQMVSDSGDEFEIEIPAFSLDSPHGKRRLN
ncbi:MAG TPA: Co2+/Mg2+ efflux protein ApaG [Hyphomicrobiaceae bacterium]|nr:Co2+/Mg2+ efflux protein ApaG [Hyphomicrobiaceae bacterium]